MCTGVELMMAAMGGMAAAQMMQQPKTPNIPQPEKPPQASKTPDRNAMAGANVGMALPGGVMSGNSGTFLTGAGGVDPSTLNLGRNTLLGQ